MFKQIIIIFILFSSLFVLPSAIKAESEVWPSLKPNYPKLVQTGIEGYDKANRNYKKYITDYNWKGDYLNWGLYVNHRNVEGVVLLDEEGIPQVNYNGEWYYNPVTVSQFALSQYGKYIRGLQSEEKFLHAAERLLTLGGEDGAYRYTTRYRYSVTGAYFEPGWVSGMAQGHILSVYARAYQLTQDKKYLEAGDKALDFMATPVENGGTLDTLKDLDSSLSNYIIFEEYPTSPATYTLNGFMFSILGVYDWWRVDPTNHTYAKTLFAKSIGTLEKILPYYDLGGFTSYDLSHFNYDRLPVVNNHYHEVHIYQLHALFSVTANENLDYYKRLWAKYVDESSITLDSVSIDRTSPQPAKTMINFTANASGGIDKQYEFLIKENGIWKVVKPYSDSNQFSWTPNEAGAYYFQVQVKNKNSSKKWDAVTTFRYDIQPVKEKAQIETISIDKVSPQPISSQINISVSAVGGEEVQYEFWIKEDGVWYKISPYSGSNKFSWSPDEAKTYYFQIQVKGKNSVSRWDDVRTFKYEITNN